MRFDLTRYWYAERLQLITLLLLPFSWIFGVLAALRRGMYRMGLLKTYYFPVPVIVVGNLTVGGTGKTPFIIWLADRLRQNGYRPGIVSRGYGGRRRSLPYQVTPSDSAVEVGDEALLLVRNTQCPLVVGVDRAAAAQYLLQQTNCNIVLSDDGLQHYRLGRAIEIAIVDGERRFGNHRLLPAGPLREPIKRLSSVDYVVVNEGELDGAWRMTVVPETLVSLKTGQQTTIAAFSNQKAHAVAGIGHPARFFQTLSSLGLDIVPHAFPDHYAFTSESLVFNDALPVVMTEKDAVKCEPFADDRYWYLKITAKIESGLEKELLEKLAGGRRPTSHE